MIKIALTKLGLEIRRNIPLFLVYAVCFYFLMPFVVIIIFLQLFSESPEKLLVFRSGNTEVMETAMANFLTQYSSSFVCGIAVVTLVLIGLVAERKNFISQAVPGRKTHFHTAPARAQLPLHGKPLHHKQRSLSRHPAQPDGISLPCLQPEHGSRKPERGEEKMPGHGDRTQQRNLRFCLLERPADPREHSVLRTGLCRNRMDMAARRTVDTDPSCKYLPRSKAHLAGPAPYAPI